MGHTIKLFALFIIAGTVSFSQGTTGKIYGRFTNIETGEPIPGLSVRIEGTKIGAASDNEGNYFIINVPPGVYNLEAAGLGYRKVKKEGIKVAVDKNTKIDFNLEYADEYVLTEKQEQYFLQKFTDNRKIELLKLKEVDKLKYQRKLLNMFYNPPANPENEIKTTFENILQLTKQIDALAVEYKQQSNEESKKKIQSYMMDKLEMRFNLQEKKMQLEIQKLSEGIDDLRKELEKFSADKEIIIRRQFETFID